jgi:hypothetical protein
VCSATTGKLSGSPLHRLNWLPFKSALTIVSGPAKYHKGWCLQVERHGKIGEDAKRLKQWGVSFRKTKGLE